MAGYEVREIRKNTWSHNILSQTWDRGNIEQLALEESVGKNERDKLDHDNILPILS